jgi:hypothetical protein
MLRSRTRIPASCGQLVRADRGFGGPMDERFRLYLDEIRAAYADRADAWEAIVAHSNGRRRGGATGGCRSAGQGR